MYLEKNNMISKRGVGQIYTPAKFEVNLYLDVRDIDLSQVLKDSHHTFLVPEIFFMILSFTDP